MPDWTTNLIAEACNGCVEQTSELEIVGFSIDTRTLRKGDVFVALIGENFDGHKFINAAIEKGASNIVFSIIDESVSSAEVGFIKVEDCLSALQQLAKFHRQRCEAKFIGVTGSNGKTTTKEILNHLFRQNYNCIATKGNLNNHIGVPLTILSVPISAEIAIIEMGMNHPGEIRDLCEIASPDCAIITNVGPAHIGIMGSLENIAKAKAEIVEELDENSFAIIPSDTEFCSLIKSTATCKVETFGTSKSSDFFIENIDMKVNGTLFNIVYNGKTYECDLPLAGRHNAFNASSSLAIYSKLGNDIERGINILETFSIANSRMEMQEIDGTKLIIDCYNANPASTEEALRYLQICPGLKVAVLGDMRELGDASESLHRKVGKIASKSNLSILITVGTYAKFIAKSAIENGMSEKSVFVLNSNEEAAELLRVRLVGKETILFKASRGMHFERIIQQLWTGLANDLH